MLKYTPKDKALPGDEYFREWTRRSKRQRDSSVSSSANTPFFSGAGVSLENYKRAKKSTRHTTPRLCGDLNDIKIHFASVKKHSNIARCEVCGEKTAFKCGLCNKFLCMYRKRQLNGGHCVLTYHDDAFYGLSKTDSLELFGNEKGKWVQPTKNKLRCNARRVEAIKQSIMEDN